MRGGRQSVQRQGPTSCAPASPVGRLGQPDEVADLALAMLGNPYMTNQVVSLDGGIYPR